MFLFLGENKNKIKPPILFIYWFWGGAGKGRRNWQGLSHFKCQFLPTFMKVEWVLEVPDNLCGRRKENSNIEKGPGRRCEALTHLCLVGVLSSDWQIYTTISGTGIPYDLHCQPRGKTATYHPTSLATTQKHEHIMESVLLVRPVQELSKCYLVMIWLWDVPNTNMVKAFPTLSDHWEVMAASGNEL